MKKKRYIILILIIIMAFLLAIGCRKKEDSISTEEPSQEIHEEIHPKEDVEDSEETTNNPDERVGVHPGNTAPSFTLPNKNNEEISINQFVGKPIVFTAWVSWSEESKKQLEILNNVALLLGDDVTFLAVHATSLDTITKEEGIAIIEDLGRHVVYLHDKDGKVTQSYFIGRFPTTFLINEQGNIVKGYTTLIEEDIILEDIQHILEQLLP